MNWRYLSKQALAALYRLKLKGAREDCWHVIDSTKMISITANLGDTKSTITHPASTTHGRLSDEQRDDSGIQDTLVRVSVGLESFEDIRDDLARGSRLNYRSCHGVVGVLDNEQGALLKAVHPVFYC